MKNTNAFNAALSRVNEDRGAVYGHPAEDFAIAAKIKDAIRPCPDPRIRHVLEMIATKMARLCTSPYHLDSWIDIAGYARTATMVMDYDDDRRSINAAVAMMDAKK